MTGKELRELNWLYDLAYNVVNNANKEYTDNAYKAVKQSMERLEKLEKAFEILKKMNGINRTLFISSICDVATDEEIELLEELMGNENTK